MRPALVRGQHVRWTLTSHFELRSCDKDSRALLATLLLLHPVTRILQQPLQQLASEFQNSSSAGAVAAPEARYDTSLRASERFAAEPGIRSNRAQRQVFRTFLKVDLMDPNRLRSVRQQDLLGQSLLLG
jgi:hypothetical protein